MYTHIDCCVRGLSSVTNPSSGFRSRIYRSTAPKSIIKLMCFRITTYYRQFNRNRESEHRCVIETCSLGTTKTAVDPSRFPLEWIPYTTAMTLRTSLCTGCIPSYLESTLRKPKRSVSILPTFITHTYYGAITRNIRNNNTFFAVGLKNSALNSLCSVEQPVEYLVTTNTSCQLFVPILKDVCNNRSWLSYERHFSEKGLFKAVQPIYSGDKKTEVIYIYNEIYAFI
jgi:hypothetical protein